MWVSTSGVACEGTWVVVVLEVCAGVGVGGAEDEEEEGAGVLVAVVKDASRDLSSLFSFFVSLRHFSSESMCILNSTFIEDSLAIF